MKLIDMRLEKDDIFKCILYIQDHFLEYSFSSLLTGKEARQVADGLQT